MQLRLSNIRQQREADCLVACAVMVLNDLQVSCSYDRVRRILGTTPAGTPFHRLDQLAHLRVRVIRGEGSLNDLAAALTSGLPVIVDVDTGELPYWLLRTDVADHEKITNHAVVVTGLDSANIYLHDPDFGAAPQVAPIGDFLLAWENRGRRYALIR